MELSAYSKSDIIIPTIVFALTFLKINTDKTIIDLLGFYCYRFFLFLEASFWIIYNLKVSKVMKKFALINKEINRIKVFEPLKEASKPSFYIGAMIISYGCVYKRSSKPVKKGSKVETIEAARKEYKELLDQGW